MKHPYRRYAEYGCFYGAINVSLLKARDYVCALKVNSFSPLIVSIAVDQGFCAVTDHQFFQAGPRLPCFTCACLSGSPELGVWHLKQHRDRRETGAAKFGLVSSSANYARLGHDYSPIPRAVGGSRPYPRRPLVPFTNVAHPDRPPAQRDSSFLWVALVIATANGRDLAFFDLGQASLAPCILDLAGSSLANQDKSLYMICAAVVPYPRPTNATFGFLGCGEDR